ncbi:hypothetical protein GQ55_2G483600 [Panicum hallii var. hallii]|uniref:J domain-containing protein n=1 Tax=Panicum hallii var. hallii TaxID=1504633 RepID=A0A2T7F0E3_9POAL|nr:hypothetical protein GQ55_2G483600 [Panicum hallii var. hallii]
MAAASSPSSAPAKKQKKWLRGNNKLIHRYLGEARAALAAAAQDTEDGDDAAAAALGLVSLALEMSPRAEAALELRARALLTLRRYRDVADMLRDYIPSCGKSCSGDDATTSSSSSCSSGSSGSGDLAAVSRVELLSPDRDRSDAGAGAARFLCFDVSELKRRLVAGFSRNSNTEAQWRYLVLGQACFHLGLMEDAVVLLQTGRRLASAAFRRESVCWSEDSFSPSNTTSDVVSVTGNRRTSKSGSASVAPASEAESVSQLLAHVKLLLRRRAAAVAALDAGLPAEAVRHFNKVLDTRRSVLPHPFATACLVGRASAFRSAGRPADAIADCNRALALDPAFIPALRARADLLESVGALPDCLRDLDHLKLLYDAALRDGKLPGPSWRPQGGIRFGEIAGAHRTLTARIQQLRGRVAAGEGCSVDYYALLGVARGCTRSELERAHLLLTLKLKPDRSVSFAERVELVDEHRDLEAVRDQARMSALFLYRMLQKGYSFIMSAVLDEEAAARQRAKDAAALAASVPKQEDEAAKAEATAPVIPMPRTVVTAAATAATPMSMSPRLFCRDMAVVGSLLSRGGFDRAIPVKCEAMSC